MSIHDKPTDPETGEPLDHYEWNGWWYCHDKDKAFDYESGEVTCPHCGGDFTVPEPDW
jgi:Zn finger protein HypA/HybF involved in hydrogenase expression